MNRLYQDYINLEDRYVEIATKSWYDEYEKFVLENIDKLNVDFLNFNPNIKMDFVLANPQIRWEGSGLSSNPNITMADVLANPQIQW